MLSIFDYSLVINLNISLFILHRRLYYLHFRGCFQETNNYVSTNKWQSWLLPGSFGDGWNRVWNAFTGLSKWCIYLVLFVREFHQYLLSSVIHPVTDQGVPYKKCHNERPNLLHFGTRLFLKGREKGLRTWPTAEPELHPRIRKDPKACPGWELATS